MRHEVHAWGSAIHRRRVGGVHCQIHHLTEVRGTLGTPSVGKMFVIISVAALGTLSKPHLYMSIIEAFIEGLMYLTEPELSNSLIPGRDNEISRSLEAFLFSLP